MEQRLKVMQEALNKLREVRNSTWTNDTARQEIDTLQVALDEIRAELDIV